MPPTPDPIPGNSVRTLTAIVRLLVTNPELVYATLCDTDIVLWVAEGDLELVKGRKGETLRSLNWVYRAMCHNPSTQVIVRAVTTI